MLSQLTAIWSRSGGCLFSLLPLRSDSIQFLFLFKPLQESLLKLISEQLQPNLSDPSIWTKEGGVGRPGPWLPGEIWPHLNNPVSLLEVSLTGYKRRNRAWTVTHTLHTHSPEKNPAYLPGKNLEHEHALHRLHRRELSLEGLLGFFPPCFKVL